MKIHSAILPFVFAISVAATAVGLDASNLPAGANHLRANRYASGDDVEMGILDTVFFGIKTPNYLGDRLLTQYDFYSSLPSDTPELLLEAVDSHESLVAHIIGSENFLWPGVAPGVRIVNAAINDLVLDSRRAASSWLRTHDGVQILNMSANFGSNTNGTSEETLYWDWFVKELDVTFVVSAGNRLSQIRGPGDSYNVITVGAYDQATQARWSTSAYTLDGGVGGTEIRGKPDILAPGVSIGDGLNFAGFRTSGTSFAAPHVAGAAALLTEFAREHPQSDLLSHRGIKALILNSARKRQIEFPEHAIAVSKDSAVADAMYDKDYLNCIADDCTFCDPAETSLVNDWTPSEWAFSGGKFSAVKPLDDEQGVGYLDATRAIVNLAGENAGPGLVAGIGWDESVITPSELPTAHTYALNQALAAGSFLTATLVWDRIVVEGDGNGIVNDVDTYAFGELANLDLLVLDSTNSIIAESISTTDNVEHLHFPLPASAASGDYKLQVSYTGGGVLATEFALAWWTDPTPLVPGDYNLDGTVDDADYNVWRAGFGNSTGTKPLVRGDGNADGIVDAADYAIWRDHVGESLPGIGEGSVTSRLIPEPDAACLVAAVGVIYCIWPILGRRSP